MGIPPGQGYGQSELQLFKLMISFGLGASLKMAAIAGLAERRRTGGSIGNGAAAMTLGVVALRMGARAYGVRGGISHDSLSSYFGTADQGRGRG